MRIKLFYERLRSQKYDTEIKKFKNIFEVFVCSFE